MMEPNRPLRILYVFRAPVGGLFRHVHDVAEALIAQGHAIGMLCDSMTGGERGERLLAGLAPRLALGLHRLPMHRNPHPSDWAAIRRVAALARAHAVDVIHGHGAKGGLYARIGGVARPGRGPIRCYTPHGGSLNYYPGSPAHRLFMAIERVLERGTDLFLFESRFIAARYHEFVHVPERPEVIALNGLYAHEFEAVAPHAEASDFLYVGEFREAKGIDTLVEALFLLANAGRHPTITLVGSGPSEARIRALIAARGIDGQFRWRGVTPAAEAFRLGRAMVVPSRFESLPYIVLEAVAGQLPLITTDVGGIPEIVPRDYPYLIPPNDPRALADAMAGMMDRPFATLKAEASAISAGIRARFSVERMVETILTAYRDTLAARRG
ncbi:MAG: glycosyltransferase [Hyphomicrobiales bacterium]|uniref:glycosyltransferase n=1 Tax=Rhabdaerophilum calidifontis TaxID=2604328 RepID=UPI00123902C5|nr:glycosyltransferase [Rhabdaerophilum calidifontis]MCA1952755.1 glycosyltransferase [Hyphomicrobiales bacterium]